MVYRFNNQIEIKIKKRKIDLFKSIFSAKKKFVNKVTRSIVPILKRLNTIGEGNVLNASIKKKEAKKFGTPSKKPKPISFLKLAVCTFCCISRKEQKQNATKKTMNRNKGLYKGLP